METIRNTVISACIVSACVSLIGGMTNGTRLGKYVKFIGELVLALILITPFVSGLTSAELSLMPDDIGFSSEDAAAEYRETVCTEAKKELIRSIGAELDKSGIEHGIIEPDLHISEDWSIYIDRVGIKADPSAAEEVLHSILGEGTEIVYAAIEENT